MFKVIVYSFYIACSVVPFVIVLAAAWRIVRSGGGQVLLCMECGQCRAACPVAWKLGPEFSGPTGVMVTVKTGVSADMVSMLALCTGCGLCARACPRGLSPLREIRRFGGGPGISKAGAGPAGEVMAVNGKISVGGET